MEIMKMGTLSVLLSMAALGGISDALGASGKTPAATPAPPTRAANPPALENPAGANVPDVPFGRPRTPKSTPMPAPAVTNFYAGLAGNSSWQPWTS